jgi:DNA-binding NarL/FixJ family response regulator
LVAAVRSVHAGRRYLSQKITETVVVDYMREHQPTDPLGKLSNRERQILQLVAEGKSTANIASTLFLSPKTVDTYRSRLMQKLEIDSMAGLVKFAIACGLTPP